MTEISWEKNEYISDLRGGSSDRWKFMIGGVLILGAIAYLVLMATTSGAQYFITVEELLTSPDYQGESVRISGAVIGPTIDYNQEDLIIDFTIAHIPKDTDDLAYTLYIAANDTNAAQLPVRIEGEVMPDLLDHEAQAILTGTLGNDGVFHATELLLKCPSRFGTSAPEEQLVGGGDS
jgi:cytochrome c-type biogenesis protein CcmE